MNNSDGYEERAGEEGKGGVGREEEELKVTAGSGTREQGETQADSSGQSADGCCGESGGCRGGME